MLKRIHKNLWDFFKESSLGLWKKNWNINISLGGELFWALGTNSQTNFLKRLRWKILHVKIINVFFKENSLRPRKKFEMWKLIFWRRAFFGLLEQTFLQNFICSQEINKCKKICWRLLKSVTCFQWEHFEPLENFSNINIAIEIEKSEFCSFGGELFWALETKFPLKKIFLKS